MTLVRVFDPNTNFHPKTFSLVFGFHIADKCGKKENYDKSSCLDTQQRN
jgi:hypothetical protein